MTTNEYKIDFQKVKESVPVKDAIQLLALRMKPESAGVWRGKCPACARSDDRSLVVTEGKGFYCHAAKRGGDVIGFVSHVRELKPFDAAQFLVGNGSGTVSRNSGNSSPQPPREEKKRSFDPAEYVKELKTDHEALQSLGLSRPTYERFQCGYRSQGVLSGRLAIRIDDAQGQFCSFAGPALGEESPSTKFGTKEFDATTIVFNAHRVTGNEVRLVRDIVEVLTVFDQTGEDTICFLTDLIEPEQHDLLSAIQQEKKFKVFY